MQLVVKISPVKRQTRVFPPSGAGFRFKQYKKFLCLKRRRYMNRPVSEFRQ